jgi:hypothetical protein
MYWVLAERLDTEKKEPFGQVDAVGKATVYPVVVAVTNTYEFTCEEVKD